MSWLNDLKPNEKLFAMLGLLSMVPIHFAFFSLSIPASLRTILDISFKTNLIIDFITVSVIGIFIGKYCLPCCFGIQALLVRVSISRKYLKRGYQRSRVFWDRVSKENTEISMREIMSEQFPTIQDARLDNFIKSKIQNSLPVVSYERNKETFTVFLGIMVTLILYVGFLRMLPILGVSLLIAYLLVEYDDAKDKHFWIIEPQLFPKKTADIALGFTISQLPVYAAILLFVSASSGYWRCNYLASSSKFSTDVYNSHSLKSNNVNIIGTTSQGFIVYNNDRAIHAFVPFDLQSSIQPKSN